MGKEAFDAFIQQNRERVMASYDWETLKKDWISQIDAFYETIAGYLDDYVREGTIKWSDEDMKLFEEHFGSYTVRKVKLLITGRWAILEPVGRFVIGAHGRIDLEGVNGEVKFILVKKDADRPKIVTRITTSFEKEEDDEQTANGLQAADTEGDLVWKIATPPPNVVFMELNQESFFDALMEVVDGQE